MPWDALGDPACLALQLSARSHAVLFWLSLAALTATLFLGLRTRWAQSQPLSKFVALSVFAHVIFAGFAYGTRIFVAPGVPAAEPIIQLALIADERGEEALEPSQTELQPGDPLVPLEPAPSLAMTESDDDPAENAPQPIAAPPSEELQAEELLTAAAALPETATAFAESSTADMAQDSPDAFPPEPPEAAPDAQPNVEPDESALAEANADQQDGSGTAAEPSDTQSDVAGSSTDEPMGEPPPAETPLPATSSDPQFAETADPAANELEADTIAENAERPAASPLIAATAAPIDASAFDRRDFTRGASIRPGDGRELPHPYQSRVTPQRTLLLERYGGNAKTEAAVAAALDWLAAHQHPDGRWRAQDHGAGQERMVLGHNRYGAGRQADTGITGLALLSFLGAGETHYEGPHRVQIQRGLEFLLGAQAADGNLAGNAELFAAMYCHGMAFLAVSEAYAMTGDERLRPCVSRAQQFTLATQIRGDGGWRYQSGDQHGDTSQLGWQLMALRSAEHAGIPLPIASRDGMTRFLTSVAAGPSGGLASYRPGTRPSPTMTAEATACWIFLDIPPRADALREAAQYLLRSPPGPSERNFYYWYYGTLALFHLQDDAWRTWNEALQTQLLSLQRSEGELAGSWDADTVWGGYGGRVYTTAMGALSLEIYYRYLPLYGSRTIADRPDQPERR